MNCESFHLGLVSYWLADLYLVPLVFFLLFVSSLGGEGELVLTVRQNHGTEIIGKLMRSGGCWEEIERCGFPDACWSSTTPPLFTCSPTFSQRIISGWGFCFVFLCTSSPKCHPSFIPLYLYATRGARARTGLSYFSTETWVLINWHVKSCLFNQKSFPSFVIRHPSALFSVKQIFHTATWTIIADMRNLKIFSLLS